MTAAGATRHEALGRFDVAIVGSGMAGSILARLLAERGRRVFLAEAGRHPRPALGESSTPLAALSLERLAAAGGAQDLAALAAWGRWSRALPGLGRGLKRGFTFYAHRDDVPADHPRLGVARRLLVAASPDDAVADAHWLRGDVDAHLVERAVEAGVVFRDRLAIDRVVVGRRGVRLAGRAVGASGPRLEVDASFVVDASGAARVLGRTLDLPAGPQSRVATALVHAHLVGWTPLERAAPELLDPPGPYPDESAAVHHLLGGDGWLYVLPFEASGSTGLPPGLVSVGLEIPLATQAGRETARRAAADPAGTLLAVARRRPLLAAQIAAARPVRPPAFVPRLQHRLGASAGRRWLVLPHGVAFTSPLFSTGMAWSLRGVERALDVLATTGPGGRAAPAAVEAYSHTLAVEADWIDRITAGALARLADGPAGFDGFAAWALLYFAAASWSEARERLLERPGSWCWAPFLGAGDPVFAAVAAELEATNLEATDLETGVGRRAPAEERRRVVEALAPRDVAGLGAARRQDRPDLYPVDLDALVAAAPLLGLDEETLAARLPRLRGDAAGSPPAPSPRWPEAEKPEGAVLYPGRSVRRPRRPVGGRSGSGAAPPLPDPFW